MEREGDYGVRTRRCTRCGHWLCRWNPGPDCWHHTPDDEDEAPALVVLMSDADFESSVRGVAA